MNLYEVDERIDELTDRLVDPETGEVDEEILAQLDNLKMAKKQKIEYLAIKSKNLRSDVAALVAEKKNIEERIKTRSNRADRIETYIGNILKGEAFSTSKADISWRRSERIDIVNEGILPDEYWKYETTGRPQKSLIKEAIKDGKEVPGAMLVEANNMTIK